MRLSGLWVILFIALLTVLIAGPFWQISGIPLSTRDAQIHLHRSAAVERAFEQGIYWPRWFPTVYNGLGAPVFHHYSPGLHWLVAAAHRIGMGLDQALKLVMTVALIVSGFGVYAWLRHVFSPAASLAGATLYLAHPNLLTRAVYFGGDYPQILALLLLPVCLWAFTALHTQARARYWAVAAISLAALVVSHNLMAMAGAVILALYWLLLAVGYRNPAGLLRCALAALLGALLSAGFWLPALADLPLVQIDSAQQGLVHYSNYFLRWGQLIGFQSPVLDSRAGNPLRQINTFGAASWLAVAAGLASVLFAARRERRVWGLAGGLFSLAMLTLTLPLSEPLWRTFAELRFFQFPSRFLTVAPLGALPAAALAVDAWPTGRRWLPGFTLVMASSLVLFPYLFPAHTPMFAPFRPVKTLSAEDTRSYEALGGAWGMTGHTTGYNEFLVRDGDMRVIRGEIPEPRATGLTWVSSHEAVADLSGQTEPMLLRLHFHPGWSAEERAKLTPGPAGWMQVTELRDPAQPLVIRWEGTAWQRRGERLGLVGLLAAVVGLLSLAWPRRGMHSWEGQVASDGSSADAPRSSVVAVGALTGCVLVLVLARFALDQSSGGPFLRRSPPGQLAFAVEGQPITLGAAATEQVTLLGWELLSSATPKAGDTVSARLYWQLHNRIDEDLHSFLHLYTPYMERSWAVENYGVLRPPTRVWDPDNYYIETIHLIIPEDVPPVTFSLVAGLVNSSGERLVAPGSTNDSIHLREMAVAPTRPGLMQGARPAIAAQAGTEDGLRLQGYDLEPDADGPILRLFWETGEGVGSDWITYIHLHDPQDEVVAQFDGPALDGLQPTGQWHTNALYIDRRKLSLPTEMPPGKYLMRVGLYSLTSGQRLPFQPEGEGQDNFENGQLLIPYIVAPPNGASD